MKKGNNMKAIRKSILCGLLVMFALFAIICIRKVNVKYPEKKVSYVKLGESREVFKSSKVSMKIKGCKWLTGEKVVEEIGKTSEIDEVVDSKTVMVTVMLQNDSEETQKIDLCNFYAESKCYYNGISPEIFEKVNQRSLTIDIEAGKKEEVVFPYTLYQNQFSDKTWNKLDSYCFYIVNQRYPLKTCWNII